MKRILNVIIAGIFVTCASTCMAEDTAKKGMSSKWICTTNASSSSKASDKTADDKMAKTYTSGARAFKFASGHCRDCTKITCEAQSK